MQTIKRVPLRSLTRIPLRNSSYYSPKGSKNFFFFIVLVKQNFACLVHRFEKFNRILTPGLNFIIPFIDNVSYTHDLREQVIEISSQVAVTKDNVALHIDGVLYIQIMDPYKASYGVESVIDAITNLAQTSMRSEIGKLALDTTFEERETLNHSIVKSIEKEIEGWGVNCIRYEIRDIEPPSNIQKSMILQAEAERRKRASILTSEGERQAKINLAEAEKQAKILRAEGKADNVIKQVTASAEALKQISSALKQKDGDNAGNFVMAEKYIDAYKGMANPSNFMVVDSAPLNASKKVKESFAILSKQDIAQKANGTGI